MSAPARVRDLAPGRCWCGSAERTTRFRTARFGLLRCAACGTHQIDPPPIADEEEASGFYSAFYQDKGQQSGSAAARTSRFWRVAERTPDFAPGRAALDCGCGEGTLCGELRDAGWKSVSGIDVSRSRVARARKRYPDLDFDDRGSLALDDRPAAFDLVVLDNVVEHLADPIAVLGKLARILSPGGRIVLITPNMESGRFRLLGRHWTPELAPHAHIFLHTAASLSALAARASLRTLRVGNFHIPLEFVGALREFARHGGWRDLAWRLAQESGGLWGRCLDEGEMVFVVAERVAEA